MVRAIVIGLTLLVAVPAGAREWRITVNSIGTRVADPGLSNMNDTGWLYGGDLGAQVEIDYGVLVGIRLRSGGGESQARTFNRDTGIELLDLLATSRWHYPALSWLRPFVEVEVGATRVWVNVSNSDLDAARWGAQVGGHAGIELRLPPGLLFDNDFSIGLELSGGYTWRSPLDFQDVNGVNLGTLNLHGAHWRLGLAVMW